MIQYSIIVPTCDRPADLRKCLQLLRSQTEANPAVEILVTYDGRTDETETMLKREFPAVRWRQGPRRGPASNRNAGARAAKGGWLIFIDDDCLPRATLFSSYSGVTGVPLAARVNPLVLTGPTCRIGTPDSLLWEAPHNPEGRALISCNFAIKRTDFLQAGGFDERFPMAIFEDTEFAVRIGLLGFETVFIPDAAVDHPLRPLPSAGKLARRWEARVISSYDFGATPGEIFLRLPRHVLLVILSRFRNRPLTIANLRAARRFVGEFALVLCLLPKWVWTHRKTPRSRFWMERTPATGIPPRLGL